MNFAAFNRAFELNEAKEQGTSARPLNNVTAVPHSATSNSPRFRAWRYSPSLKSNGQIDYIQTMASNPPGMPGYDAESVRSSAMPEILPPETGYGPPPRPVRPQRSRWAVAPATNILVGINCAVFLLMTLTGVSPIRPTTESLFVWGADHTGAILIGGQWWRIVTAMFVHGGILHLGVNMWCLWNLGMLAEPLMGTVGVFAVYILTGAAGDLLSTCFNWFFPIHSGGAIIYPVGVGASGAVFGIAGALIVLLKSNRLPVPPREIKSLRKSVIYFAVINLVLGFGINAGSSVFGTGILVDNMAHLGGFSSGLLFAMPMWPRIGTPRKAFDFRLRVAIAMVTGILVLFGFYLAQLPK
jgi:rhomboid protease GluP